MPATRNQRAQRPAPVPVAVPPARRSAPPATAAPLAPTSAITPQQIQEIVSSVTAEVTRRLQSAATPVPGLDAVTSSSSSASAVTESPIVRVTEQVAAPPTAVAQHAVQHALGSAHPAISGETFLAPTSNHVQPTQEYQSISLPIDCRISIKLKNKIWNDEYIDFGSLLSNPMSENKFQLSFSSSDAGLPPSLSVELMSKSKKIANISVWMSAFRIFVGVYTQKYPHESPALMKYGDIVQDLADRGQNWRFYDENFRFLRQYQRSSLSWANVHWELWLRSQNTSHKFTGPMQRTASTPSGRGPQNSIPRGYCFKFHKGKACSGCEFKHSCFKCDSLHPGLKCNFRGQFTRDFSRPLRSAKSGAAPNANQSKSA